MKILTLLGVASLLANAALLAVVGYGVLAPKPPRLGGNSVACGPHHACRLGAEGHLDELEFRLTRDEA